MPGTPCENPKVSVIIPVWNPGPGISRCIDSLRNQTLKEIEIIFVDDCGTDDSMDKVMNATEEDSRIRILTNEENYGPGISRNRGIESAQGEYLSFVDADDYIAPDFLELLYLNAHQTHADIAKGQSILVRKDGSIVRRNVTANQRIRDKLAKGEPLYSAFTRGHQNTIFRTDFIKCQNVRYGLSRRFEDVLFLLQACSNSKVFLTVDKAYYYYCDTPNSLMHSLDQIKPYAEGIHELAEYASNSLPENKYTAGYLRDLFLSAIRELYRYTDSHEGEILGPYSDAILSELSYSPYFHSIVSDSFPLRIWHDYGYLLPLEPFYYVWEDNNPPVQYAKLVEKWVDFFLATPEESEACWKELRRIIVKAAKSTNDKSNTMYSATEQKEGKALLKRQKERLPLNRRVQLGALETKANVRRIVSKVLPKPIKQTMR